MEASSTIGFVETSLQRADASLAAIVALGSMPIVVLVVWIAKALPQA
jgi:hypothetical protein